MTWNQISAAIARMSAERRKQEAVLIEDYVGPEQRVRQVEITEAEQDVYDGMTAGNVLVLEQGESFLVPV